MINFRSRRASTKLVTAATKAAVLQTSPQFAKKFASTVEKVNKSERKTVALDLSHKEVVKEKEAKKSPIPQENKKKVVSNKKPPAVISSLKRKLSPEKVSNKRKKTKLNREKEEESEEENDDSTSIRRSRRETTRISTLATLNSSNAADAETKSRESSVESTKSEPIQEEKKSPVKVSTTKSQKKDSQVNKKSKTPQNAENKPRNVKQRSTNGDAAGISKERKKTQKPLPSAPRPAPGGARRSARSSTAISTLASNSAASQAAFEVEESTSEDEEEADVDHEEDDKVKKVETTPKKRGRGRPKADVTPLSPNNPFAAITREYKEQQKIAAKLKRKRKSSLSPDDRPRLLTEAENNKLFDSLFDGDSASPPPPPKVVKQKSRSSNSSNKQSHTDTTHESSIASPKSVVLEANNKPRPETKPASIKKPEIKAQTSTKKESAPPPPTNVPPSSLKWLQSSSLSPLKTSPAPRVIAPWRQICDQKGRDKKTQEKEDTSDDVYEFSGPVEQGEKKIWGRTKPDLESPERKMFMISKHGAYSGQLAGLKRKLEQKREELEAGGAASPEQETRNGSPPHKAMSGSPMIDPSQRVGHGAPRPQGKARLGSQRLGGAIKGSLTTPGSHQLSLTSLASDYNIVAAVSKYHNNIVPASSPDIPRHFGLNSEPEPDQNLPEKGRRKSFLLSKIFSKPKDQDSEDSDNADNGVSAEEEEKSVKDVKKAKQKKSTANLRRPLRNSSSRNVSLREASSESEGSGGAEERLGERTQTSIVCTSCHKYITTILRDKFVTRHTFCYRDDISLVKQLVKKYGSLTWASSVDASTSHVVSGEGKRTLNLLQGLLQGCWIVSKVIIELCLMP